MLDPDISTHDALRLLTVPDHDPTRMGRRRFLQLLGAGAAAGAGAATGAGAGAAATGAAAPISSTLTSYDFPFTVTLYVRAIREKPPCEFCYLE